MKRFNRSFWLFFKIAFAVCFLFFLVSSSFAQDQVIPYKFGGVGLGFSSNVPGNIIGTGFVGLPIPGLTNAYSITSMQVSGADDGGGNATFAGKPIQYDMKQFIAYKFATYGRLSIFSMIGGGFTAVDTNVLGSFGAGGMLDIKLNETFGFFFGPLVEYNSLKERTFNPWLGFRVKF